MGHPEQLAFVNLASRGILEQTNIEAIEIGSYDVNGNTRAKFHPSVKWVGVDLVEGPGVDIVNFGHLVEFPDNKFDISVFCECFEHDEFWVKTFENMVRMTKPGGTLIFTCASKGRPEHGTTRSQADLSPGTQSAGLDYYQNLNQADFENQIEFQAIFSQHAFFYNPITFDLYFIGQKLGTEKPPIKLPTKSEVKSLKTVTTIPHRLVRTPLYVLLKILPLTWYNNISFRYWLFMVKLESRFYGSKRIRIDNR